MALLHPYTQCTESETEPLLKDAKQSHDTAAAPTAGSPVVSLRTRLKQLVPIVGVFAPLVVFWAIYYQQNSTWVTQGAMMDCYLGRLHIPPGEDFRSRLRKRNLALHCISIAIGLGNSKKKQQKTTGTPALLKSQVKGLRANIH